MLFHAISRLLVGGRLVGYIFAVEHLHIFSVYYVISLLIRVYSRDVRKVMTLPFRRKLMFVFMVIIHKSGDFA